MSKAKSGISRRGLSLSYIVISAVFDLNLTEIIDDGLIENLGLIIGSFVCNGLVWHTFAGRGDFSETLGSRPPCRSYSRGVLSC